MKATTATVCALGAAFGLAVSASAGNMTLTWDASATPETLGDAATGLLQFTYAGDKVSSIVATPVDGGTITVTGDAIAFSTGMVIQMNAAGNLVFENSCTGAGNVTVSSALDMSEKEITCDGLSLDTSFDRTIFTGKNLSEWEIYKTQGSGGYGPSADRYPYCCVRTENSLTAQMQTYTKDGSNYYFVSIKIILRQQGDDIVARAVMAPRWYGPTYYDLLGTDMDLLLADLESYAPGYTLQWLNTTHKGVTTASGGAGYSVAKFWLRRIKGLPIVHFKGGLTTNRAGQIKVNDYAHVIVEGCATGAFSGYNASEAGILTFRNPANNFEPAPSSGSAGNGIMGSGRVEFEATDEVVSGGAYDLSYSSWIPSNIWVTVAECQQLSALTNVSAVFGGAPVAPAFRQRVPMQCFVKSNDGLSATVQFHQLGTNSGNTTNRLMAVWAEFRQNGRDIQMRATAAGLINRAGFQNLYGQDLTVQNPTYYYVTVNNEIGTYGIHDLVLQFSAPQRRRVVTIYKWPAVAGNFKNPASTSKKATIAIRGTDTTTMSFDAETGNSFATRGLVEVENGGELAMNLRTAAGTAISKDYVDDLALLRICEGGKIVNQYNHGFGVTQRIDVVGGVLEPYGQATKSLSGGVNSVDVGNGCCHVNRLHLKDGARVMTTTTKAVDPFVRAGYGVDVLWTVDGTLPSYCDVGLRLWGKNATRTCTFCVLESAELVMNGSLSVDSGNADVVIRKTGDGMMTFNNAFEILGRPVSLFDGTWKLNASGITSAADPYTLDGGTLAVADGTANSLGVLTVGAAGGGITLGAGATLTFADSSAAEWTGETADKVIITGFAEKSIRFGTTRDGLTTAQRLRLRTSDDRRLFLDADGYLTTTGPGIVFSLR